MAMVVMMAMMVVVAKIGMVMLLEQHHAATLNKLEPMIVIAAHDSRAEVHLRSLGFEFDCRCRRKRSRLCRRDASHER
jgi:hypothetical protein